MDIFHKHLKSSGVNYKVVGDQTLFDVVFSDMEILNYRDYISSNKDTYQRFNSSLRENGIFKLPGKVYVSSVLTEIDFQLAESAISRASSNL